MTWRIQCIRVRALVPILFRSANSCENSNPQRNYAVNPTIVPKVINPTKAFAGKRDKLIIKVSFKAFKLSSSWQVSTTYRKIGGADAGRAN